MNRKKIQKRKEREKRIKKDLLEKRLTNRKEEKEFRKQELIEKRANKGTPITRESWKEYCEDEKKRILNKLNENMIYLNNIEQNIIEEENKLKIEE